MFQRSSFVSVDVIVSGRTVSILFSWSRSSIFLSQVGVRIVVHSWELRSSRTGMYDGFEFSFVKSEAGNLSMGVILLVGGTI